MLVASTPSSENLENLALEKEIESTTREFLSLDLQTDSSSRSSAIDAIILQKNARSALDGTQNESGQRLKLSGSALQLHDTGALEEALALAERKRADASARGENEETSALRSERVAARVAELLARQEAKSRNEPASSELQITTVPVRRPPPTSVEAESTFLQISRHLDPNAGKETLDRAALQVKLSDTRVVAAKYVVAETESRLRSAAVIGMKTISEAMGEHQYNTDVQQAGCKSLSDLAAKLKGKKEPEVAVQAMQAVISAVRCLAHCEPVQEAACVALCHLAPLVEVSSIFEEGSEAMAAVLSEYTSNAAVLTHACRAMTSLVVDTINNPHARTRAIQSNVLMAIVKGLKAQPNFGVLHEAAMELLVKLVTTDADRTAFWALGGTSIPSASLLTHSSLPSVVQNGCALIEILCNTPARADQANDAGAIDAVLMAMRSHRGEAAVQVAGAQALKAMIVTARGKAMAAAGGAMEAAAVALFGHPDDVKMQEAGARLIKSLAVIEAVRSRSTAMAVIEGLCASISTHRENMVIASEGCGALCNLCIDQPLNRQRLAESGAAAAVTAAMVEHRFTAEVLEAGCAVLWILGGDPGGDVTHEAPGVIVQAMQRFPDVLSLQTVACAAIRAIAEQPGSEEALIKSGALDCVLEALRANGANSALQQNGLEALCSLIKNSEYMKRAAVDEGAMDLCRSAMVLRFSGDEAVTSIGEKVLDMLESAVWITTPTLPVTSE